MDSKVGLIIQLNGVFLVTVMCVLLGRSLKLTALKYWTVAWLALSFSLISLRLAFSTDTFSTLLLTYYCLGEYVFGFLLVAGCRTFDGSWELKPRTDVLIVPFLILSLALPNLFSDFNNLYGVHALTMSGFFMAAFIVLNRSPLRTFGWRVLRITLIALFLDFFIYSAVFTSSKWIEFDTWFLAYNSIVDLVLETALGFGMVIVLLEKVLVDAKAAHERLEVANKRLEELVHIDPLTAAFSRHAFYGFVKKQGDENSETSGCVGFFDIDDLKGMNDRYGHAAGDMVIRVVSKTLREAIRAEDLIFRWGGDEFFVIMISMDAEMALIRMTKLETALTNVILEGVPEPVTIGVSWGFTDFADISGLEEAINRADAAMYARKAERKRRRGEKRKHIPDVPDHTSGLAV